MAAMSSFVSLMLLIYASEHRSRWYILAFAAFWVRSMASSRGAWPYSQEDAGDHGTAPITLEMITV